ncbi:MAG TPA: hypothetical protein VMR33_02390 [Candidatus Baltobacteraceae bacterium]|jgi:hypothetical protein|nr:hypothetical protein [Candidatus Baltobacteraceae bacterium]
MKTKLRSIILIVAAAGLSAGGYGYVSALASRTRLLEARLARVEAGVNGNTTAIARIVALPAGSAKPGAVSTLWPPQVSPPGGQQDSLEWRVEKIERELTPHLEFISVAAPEAPDAKR